MKKTFFYLSLLFLSNTISISLHGSVAEFCERYKRVTSEQQQKRNVASEQRELAGLDSDDKSEEFDAMEERFPEALQPYGRAVIYICLSFATVQFYGMHFGNGPLL